MVRSLTLRFVVQRVIHYTTAAERLREGVGEKEREYNSDVASEQHNCCVTGSGDTSASSVFASPYIGVGRVGWSGGGGGGARGREGGGQATFSFNFYVKQEKITNVPSWRVK